MYFHKERIARGSLNNSLDKVPRGFLLLPVRAYSKAIMPIWTTQITTHDGRIRVNAGA